MLLQLLQIVNCYLIYTKLQQILQISCKVVNSFLQLLTTLQASLVKIVTPATLFTLDFYYILQKIWDLWRKGREKILVEIMMLAVEINCFSKNSSKVVGEEKNIKIFSIKSIEVAKKFNKIYWCSKCVVAANL